VLTVIFIFKVEYTTFLNTLSPHNPSADPLFHVMTFEGYFGVTIYLTTRVVTYVADKGRD